MILIIHRLLSVTCYLFILFLLPGSLDAAQMLHGQELSLSSEQNAEHTLTLEEALDRAYKQRADLAAYDQLIQAFYWQAQSALVEYAPTITLSGSVLLESRQKGFHGNTQLTGNQLIYQFGGPLEKYKRDKKYQREQIYTKEQASNAIRLAVEQAFIAAWLLQREEPVVFSQLTAARAAYQQACHEWKLKLLDRSVYYAARATFAAAQASARQLNADLAVTGQALAFLMGEKEPLCLSKRKCLAFNKSIKYGKNNKCAHNSHNNYKKLFYCNLVWRSPEQLTIASLDFYHQKAFSCRSDLKAKNERLKALALNKRIIEQSSLPIFGLSGTAAHNSSAPQGLRSSVSFGPTMSWNIFDGTLSAHQARRASADYLAQVLNKEHLAREIKNEVSKSYYALRKAVMQLDAQRSSLVAAYNLFTFQRQEYTLGDISAVEFKAAQATWRTQYLAWQKTVVNVTLAERELAFACGYPGDS